MKHAISAYPGKFKGILTFPEGIDDVALQFESANLKLRATGDKGQLEKQHDCQMALPIKPLGTDVGTFCIRLTKEHVKDILDGLEGTDSK